MLQGRPPFQRSNIMLRLVIAMGVLLCSSVEVTAKSSHDGLISSPHRRRDSERTAHRKLLLLVRGTQV